MEELLRIQGCVEDHPSSLHSTLDKIIVHVHGLEPLGISSRQYGSLLIPVIMSKLPDDIHVRAACETNKDVWDIDDLLVIIKQEVEAREASEGTRVNPNIATSHPARGKGEHGAKCKEMLEEDHRQGYLKDGGTEHLTCGGRVYHKL